MHYYKRNLGDYAKKAGRLSMLQHGSYTLLLDACYDREQFPTRDEAIDWTWASSTAEIEAVDFVLTKFFTLEDGRYVQERVREELLAYQEKAETNKRIAAERETKRKEGATNRSRTVHEAPPNQEPRTTNQEPRTTNQEPLTNTPSVEGVVARKRGPAPTSAARPDDVSEPVWQDFQRLRRDKRAPLTDTALAGVRREAERAGVGLEVALAYCCEAGWQGFNAGWYAERQGQARVPNVGGASVLRPNKQEALEQRNRAVAAEWVREKQRESNDAAV